jgi:uncharacterized protein YcbX
MTGHPAQGTVLAVRRHPVKSVEGESLDACEVDRRGLRGDRAWAVCDPDGKLGSGKSSSRFRRMDGLRQLAATFAGEVPVLTFADGSRVRGDAPEVHERLSAHVGRGVRLEPEGVVPHHDDGPVHLVTTAALRSLARDHGTSDVDWRRTRANLLVEWPGNSYAEDSWVGSRVAVGDVVLEVAMPMPRCVMVTAPTRDLEVEPGLLRTITDANDGGFGVLAEVVRPGTVRVGDPVRLLGLPG